MHEEERVLGKMSVSRSQEKDRRTRNSEVIA